MRRPKYLIAREKLGRMAFAERTLLLFSFHPDTVDQTSNHEKPSAKWTIDSALIGLRSSFEKFDDLVKNRTVLDYGCGDGFQAVAIAKLGAKFVQGVDVEEIRLKHAQAIKEDLPNIEFTNKASGKFDVVISLDAMEHFNKPEQCLREMADCLKPDGKMLICFGPPWYAPHGHHMYFFCILPWFHLYFSERTVMRIRSVYRSDNATSYLPEGSPGLNRMSLARFESLVRETGLRIERIKYYCTKRVTFMSKIPIIREYFVRQVDAVLTKQYPRPNN